MTLKLRLILFVFLIGLQAKGQNLYYPPLSGNTWDTLSPSTLNWCQPQIDSLYNFLDQKNTDAFIVLKDGKIVLEKYFGTFTLDSIHYWASAGKSLTAVLTGIAQQNNLLNINDSVAAYLGTGWTAAPAAKENAITVRHLLSMNSGLDDTPTLPCNNEDTAASCLQYLADAGTRWSYHTGAYRKLQQVISNASGLSYTAYTNLALGSHIGMSGLWYDGVFYSKPRSMARFGLFVLGNGIWGTDSVLTDTTFYNAMVNTSQTLNLSYGYLWWLNGKASCMVPTLQVVFPFSLMPNAPPDMFCALGKNDQKIYVVPSQNLVVIRMGDAADTSAAALTAFDNQLWGKIDSLDFCPTGINEVSINVSSVSVYPSIVTSAFKISANEELPLSIQIFSADGKMVSEQKLVSPNTEVSVMHLPAGLYIVNVQTANKIYRHKVIKQ